MAGRARWLRRGKVERKELDTSREIEFPQDHGPHPGMSTERWYFTGMLENQQGKRFAYFYTWFLHDGMSMILMDPVDLQSGHKGLEEFIGAMEDKAIAREGLDLRIGDSYRLKLLDKGDFLIKCEGKKAGMEPTIHPEKEYAINGDNGYMEMSSGGTSAYYSCTRMSAEGAIYLEGQEMNVTGDCWLDRQWGNW